MIDYENVHENGLVGCEKLTKSDCIYLFFTENAKPGSLDSINSRIKATLIPKKVPAGEQSLDKHLIAYLGYLIGKNDGQQTDYIIVSKDTGYDEICSFLHKKTKSKVIRQEKIAHERKTQSPATPKKSSVASQKTSGIKQNIPAKTKLNQEIQQTLSKENYNQETICTVAKLVCACYGNEHFLSNVHKGLRDTYKKPSEALEIYKVIKPILKEYTVAPNINSVKKYS